jgi:hypothetical protein
MLGVSSASAQQPNYHDDDLVGAIKEILSMEKDELIKFKEYFAECHNDDLEKNEVIQHRCNVARDNYELEFASNRAVDRIIHDYNSMTRYVRLSSNGSPVIEENAKIIKRMVAVSHDIKRTINARFVTVRQRPSGERD